MEPQLCDDQRARMTRVLEKLCRGPPSKAPFANDQPDDVRDECFRLLLERGACTARAWCDNPVVSRIVCELAQLARVPQLINEAVVGLVFAHQGQQPPVP
ncbi:hypothetical protein FOA52_008549 [Chlamydomonas sp. UWO 241]|nr:hypothetical protein FOA52_008549 [Chlamydomonas sp. UWO 241]